LKKINFWVRDKIKTFPRHVRYHIKLFHYIPRILFHPWEKMGSSDLPFLIQVVEENGEKEISRRSVYTGKKSSSEVDPIGTGRL
jgi:hypothetical protein